MLTTTQSMKNPIDNTQVGEYVYISMKKGYRTPSWFRSKKQIKDKQTKDSNRIKGYKGKKK